MDLIGVMVRMLVSRVVDRQIEFLSDHAKGICYSSLNTQH